MTRTMKGFVFLIEFLFVIPLFGQTAFRVMSYNVENAFFPEDDPSVADEEYTPDGLHHWNYGRYYRKLRHIAQVITVAGEWDTPALVGLCEVENDSVVQHLLYRTPLRRQQYQYCMTHGNDRRGINSVLLYQRDKFALVECNEIPVRFSRTGERPTRNILHVAGRILTSDTLDVFVVHFPSRYGGEKETMQKRKDAAATLRNYCDSLYSVRYNAQILIMGDFNDGPDDESVRDVLGASSLSLSSAAIKEKDSLRLVNLFGGDGLKSEGSHKYHDEWNQLDQIIVSASLLGGTSPFRYVRNSRRVLNPSFLLVEDKTWRGQRPFRSFHGFKYEGGYSDHLPLVADFVICSNGFLSLY